MKQSKDEKGQRAEGDGAMTYEKRGNEKFGFAVWATTPGWKGVSFKVADVVSEKWADKLVEVLRAQEGR